MRAYVRVLRTESGLEQFEGTLTNNDGVVFHRAVRWSEEGAVKALAAYLHEEDGDSRVSREIATATAAGGAGGVL